MKTGKYDPWRDILPDFGMLYRSPVRSRAEIDALRKLTSRGRVHFVPLPELQVEDHENHCISRVDTERLLSRLTARERGAVKLAFMEGLGPAELADELGIKYNAAAFRRAAGMRKLRRLVQ